MIKSAMRIKFGTKRFLISIIDNGIRDRNIVVSLTISKIFIAIL